MAAALLPLAVGIGQQRGGAGHEQAHVARRVCGEARVVQQAGVEGRHPHHHRGARQPAENVAGIEFRQQDHRSASRQADIGGDEQAVDMEERQRMQQHVIGREAPEVH